MNTIDEGMKQRIQGRKQLLGEMFERAETLFSHFTQRPSHYDLVCLWMSITSSQLASITDDADHKVMGILVSKILDTEIEGRVLDAMRKEKPTHLKLIKD